MPSLNMGELLLLLLLAVVILGPTRLPEYTRKLARGARRLRELTDDARGRLSEELGPDFDDVDWKSLDPRQYDPRRIVREAFNDGPEDTGAARAAAPTATEPRAVGAAVPPVRPTRVVRDPDAPTPFDPEAT